MDTKILQLRFKLHYPKAMQCIEIDTAAANYAVHAKSGKCFLIQDEEYTQMPHNPFPWIAVLAKTLVYAPAVILFSCGIALFFTMLFYFFLPASPDIQEAFLLIIATMGYWSHITAWLFVVMVFGFLAAVYFSTMYGGFTLKSQQESTDAAGLLLVASKFERDASLKARLDAARNVLHNDDSNVNAVLVLRFRDPVAVMYMPDGKEIRMERSTPIKIDMPEYKPDTLFVTETFAEFEAYRDLFTSRMKEQLLKDLHFAPKKINDVFSNHMTLLSKPMAVLAFLLVSVTCTFASKGDQLKQYVGETNYNTQKPVGKVLFIFKDATLSRNGDGQTTWRQLLPAANRYSDASNAGELIAVKIITDSGIKTLPPVVPVKAAPATDTAPVATPSAPVGQSTDPVRPRPAPQPFFDTPQSQTSIPDSLKVIEGIETAKKGIELLRENMSKWFSPIHAFFIYLFSLVISVAVFALGILYFISKSATNESLISNTGRIITGGWIVYIQQNAVGFMMIIIWFIGVCLLTEFFIILNGLGFQLWMLCIIWLVVIKLSVRASDWIVPNLKMNKRAPY